VIAAGGAGKLGTKPGDAIVAMPWARPTWLGPEEPPWKGRRQRWSKNTRDIIVGWTLAHPRDEVHPTGLFVDRHLGEPQVVYNQSLGTP
jgi:hypothetical protein